MDSVKTKLMLDQMFGNLDEIAKLPIEKQAKYSDHVIGEAILNNELEFLEDQIQMAESLEDKMYERWNSCSLGCSAHIAVNCQDEGIRKRALSIHTGYMEWYRSQNLICKTECVETECIKTECIKTESMLDQMFGNIDEIAKLPIEKQAKYADHVSGGAVLDNNLKFLEFHMTHIESMEDKMYEQWNSCSLGNIAHFAVNCQDEGIRKRALSVHTGYMDWYQSRK